MESCYLCGQKKTLYPMVMSAKSDNAHPTRDFAMNTCYDCQTKMFALSDEEMIDMLNSGVSVLTLFELISRRLQTLPTGTTVESLESSSRWICDQTK